MLNIAWHFFFFVQSLDPLADLTICFPTFYCTISIFGSLTRVQYLQTEIQLQHLNGKIIFLLNNIWSVGAGKQYV